MNNHLFIGCGTSHNIHLPEHVQLPMVADVIKEVTGLFTGDLAYTQVLSQISMNPASQDLRVTLDNWLRDPVRDETDWVVMYYTGHGEMVGTDTLYLLTTDYDPGSHAATAFPLAQLADMLIGTNAAGQRRKTKRFLLFLDTCFSGNGLVEFQQKLSSLFKQGADDVMFCVIASALPFESAMAGKLADALTKAIRESSLGGTQQEFLYFDQLLPRIKANLGAYPLFRAMMDTAAVEPRFFPNPRYIPGLPQSVPVADLHFASLISAGKSWNRNNWGIEVNYQSGWNFSGREKVLDELSQWANDPLDFQMRIITGQPGAGKSAIISRVVMLADPEYFSENMVKDQPRFPHVSLAIHAKGRTAADIVNLLAANLGVAAEMAAIKDALARAEQVFFFVLDALDEAGQPHEIAVQVLVPLSGMSKVKVLVATRKSAIHNLVKVGIVSNIDDEKYLNINELSSFVETKLLDTSTSGQLSPYHNNTGLSASIARVIAGNAYPNFLISRLVTESLLSLKTPLTPETLENIPAPHTLTEAFGGYLERFGKDRAMLHNLLLPLAFSLGAGLPREQIWSLLASKIAGKRYTDNDINRAMQIAGSYIIESLDQGRSVYRLYHQAFADYLRQDKDEAIIHNCFVDVLIQSLPMLPDTEFRDWTLAGPYIRRHLITHAVKCERVEELLADPLFLLVADTAAVLSSFNYFHSSLTKIIQYIYKAALHQIRERPLAEAAAYLRMAALQYSMTELANHPSLRDLSFNWELSWARWKPEASANNTIGYGTSPVTATSTGIMNGRSILLLGRHDGTIDIWDMADGTKLHEWKAEGAIRVEEIRFDDPESNPLVLACWENKMIGILELVTGKTLVKPSGGKILAACLATRRNSRVCVTADDKREMVMWSLPVLEIVVKNPGATRSLVYDLCEVKRGSEKYILSTGDYLAKETDEVIPYTLYCWSLEDLSLQWKSDAPERGVWAFAETAAVLGKNLAVLSQNHYGGTEVWDLESGERLFRDDKASDHAWIYNSRGRVFLIEVGFGKFNARRLSWLEEHNRIDLGAPLFHGDEPVIYGEYFRIVEVGGRQLILSGVQDKAFIWDIEDMLVQEPLKHITDSVFSNGVGAVAAGVFGKEFYAGPMDKMVSLDVTTGEIVWETPLEGVKRSLAAIDQTIVANMGNGRIAVMDRSGGEQSARAIRDYRWVEALKLVKWRDRAILLATVDGPEGWEVCAWDLKTLEQLPTEGAYRLSAGQEDKPLHGLAAEVINDKIKIAFSSKYSMVMVADFECKSPDFPAFENFYLPNMSGEYVYSLVTGTDGPDQLLVAGTQYGHLCVWDFRKMKQVAARDRAHMNPIKCLCFMYIDKKTVLVSGAGDGRLSFWTTRLKQLFTIETKVAILTIVQVGNNMLAVGTSSGLLMFRINDIPDV